MSAPDGLLSSTGPWRAVGLAPRSDGSLVVAVEDGHERGHLWSPGAGDPPVREVAGVLNRVHHPALPRLLDVITDDGDEPVALVTTPIADRPPNETVDVLRPASTADREIGHELCSLVLALDLAGASLAPGTGSPVSWDGGDLRLHDLTALRDRPRTDRLAAIRPVLPPEWAASEGPDEVLAALRGGSGPGPDAVLDRRTRRGAPVHGPRTLGAAVAAVALVVGGLALAASPRDPANVPPPRPRPCPATAATSSDVTVVADVDGDGCPDAVGWDGERAEATVHPAAGQPVAFALGAPGDQLLVGDWDGDGAASPALYRASTGVLATFDDWPTATGAEVTADSRDTGVRGGRAALRRVDGGPDSVEITPPRSGRGG